jgi:hypothetical protein
MIEIMIQDFCAGYVHIKCLASVVRVVQGAAGKIF